MSIKKRFFVKYITIFVNIHVNKLVILHLNVGIFIINKQNIGH